MEFPRHIRGLVSNRRDVMAGLLGFLLTIALLDSGGLAQWARRLEIGPLRRVAVPMTTAINQTLRPLGIDPLRHVLLADLARLHWTRDRAAQQAASRPLPRWATLTIPPAPTTPPRSNAATIINSANHKPTKPLPLKVTPRLAQASLAILTKLPLHTPLPALTPLPPGVHRRTIALVGDSMMAVGMRVASRSVWKLLWA